MKGLPAIAPGAVKSGARWPGLSVAMAGTASDRAAAAISNLRMAILLNVVAGG